MVLNNNIPDDLLIDMSEIIDIRKQITKTIIIFALPFAIWGAASWLQSSSERWVIAKYLSTTDVGIYAIMSILANYLITIPSGIIGQFAQPIIYQRASAFDDQSKKSRSQALKYYIGSIVILSIGAIIFSLLFGRQVILIVSNPQFCKYWHILPLLCIGIGVFQIGQALTIVGFVQNTPQKYLFAKLFSGIFAVISNIFFISLMGIIGIAISICIASIVYLVLVIYANYKINQLELL
jgi:O-antigen/teichoic acid export membrane protein